MVGNGASLTANVCCECLKNLKAGRVPPRSLVRVDAGPTPTYDAVVGKQPDGSPLLQRLPLPALTELESLIVSRWRPYR